MPAIIIHNLWFGHRPGMLNNRSTNGVNPLLFLLIRIGNKIHSLSTHGKLKGEWSIENIFSTFDGETCRDRDDASWFGGSRNDAFFEPEELPSLQDEPPAAPRLYVLSLLHKPSCSFWIAPEIDLLRLHALWLRLSFEHAQQRLHVNCLFLPSTATTTTKQSSDSMHPY